MKADYSGLYKMRKIKNLQPGLINPKALFKRMLLGEVIGLIVISFFLFSVDEPNPEWGNLWMVRPLILTPLAGAFGILSFYLRDFVGPQSKVMSFLVFLTSLILFIIALWLGIVLGLDGTLWN